ncbi:AMP-binding protein [Glutamicibacter soli]|uniref:AMP-binding protein n=1 Tax=Glutamicibacter soli TaxID=453836 RepID=A0A6L9G9A7_9MICC|nr:condensation domain-containing protein [Glutamicibacter soli]NAZ17020.1 AMP-binding protein [Glutamicibacter soli]
MTELTRHDVENSHGLPDTGQTPDPLDAQLAWWPTTALQRGLVAHTLLLHDQAQAADPYVGQTRVRLTGQLDPDEARAATLGLLRRVENLRAGFLLDETGDPVSFVEPWDGQLAARVFTTGPDVEALAGAQAAAGFDLQDPPLLRFALASESSKDHELVITAHHLVLDGWSMPLLLGQWLRELAAVRGTRAPSDLPAATGSYAEHLGWIASADREAAADFFAQTLAHADTGPRPHFLGAQALAGTGRASEIRELPAATVTALNAAARTHGFTPATALRTAWALAADFAAGTTGTAFALPVALRDPSRPDAGGVCGMLTETVLASGDYQPGESLLDAAVRQQQWWNRSLEHQHLGVPGIERALSATGELAWSLLSFDAGGAPDRFTLDGLQATLQATGDSSHYPVNVHVRAGERWQIELDYDARVPAHMAATMAEALLRALTALALHPESSIAGVELMDPAQVAGFGTSGRDYAGRQPLLPELFARLVAAAPQATALVVGGASYSYAELDVLAQQAAVRLAGLLGTATGHRRLAVRLPRGVDIVVAHLAALRSAVTLVVLDNGWPAARVERALQLTSPALIWDGEGLRATGIGSHPAPAPIAPQSSGTAGIVFTSGSTGEPKAVAVPHRALAHLAARQQRELYPAGRTLQVAHTSAFHFDAHWDAFLALFTGHTLHLLTEDEYLDPFALSDYVAAHRIGYLDFTPTLWNAVISSGAMTRLPEICVAGGESFPAALWQRMGELARESGSVVYNLYGPTEATVDALAAAVADAPEPVVGRPVGATGALVLDSQLRRVAPGTVGELYLAGPQLADGYLSRSALTAARFTAHPFAPGERLYRTGDAAAWRPDGQLALLGRTDAQISLHGVRIEPGEIEAFLTGQDAVRRAAVLKVQDPRLGERLAAWVVPSDPSAVGDSQLAARLAGQLRAACAGGLPRAMVPAAVVLLESLPVTGSGKLDSRALPAPDFGVADPAKPAESGAVAGASDAELAAVTAVVTRVLGLSDEPSPEQRFMALGGDSIAAIQVIAGLHREGYGYSVAKLLAAGTLADMARELEARQSEPAAAGTEADGTGAAGRLAALGAERAAVLADRAASLGAVAVDVWELTATQLGMVLHHERETDGTYQTTTRWRLAAADETRLPDAGQVARALDTLAARHPQLRGVIFQHDLPAPRLAILDRMRWKLQTEDLRSEPDAAAAAGRVEEALRAEPMDLATGPLASGLLLRTSDTAWELVLCMHHLLVDGWSTALLTEELDTLLAGGELPEPRPMTGYLQWLAELETSSGQLEAAWRSEFAGFGAPTTLAALTRAGEGTVRATAYLQAPSTARLSAALRASGHTLADAAQAAWATVLAAATGTADVALGATRSGRDAEVPGIDEMIGMFITTAPVRLQPRPGAPCAELLEEARRQNTALARAAHLGMGRIKSVLGAEPFDTLLVVENYPHRGETAVSGLEVTALGGQDGTNYPVCLTLTPGEELALEVELAGGDPLVAAALAQAVRTALAALAGGTQPQPEQLGLQLVTARLAEAARAESETAQPAPVGAEKSPDAVSTAVEDTRTALAVQAVAEVLQLDSVDPSRDIFALGADSMAVIALIGALRARGLVISLGEIYRNPTAAGLAAAAAEAAPTRAAELAADGMLEDTPALAWYRGLLARTGADGRGFQQLRVLNVPAGIRAESLQRALTTLAEHHPALRLRVDGTGAEVLPGAKLPLTTLPAGTGETQFSDALRTACQDLDERAGRVAAAVYRPAESGYGVLALAVHHVAVDIYSWRLLTDDLRRLVEDTHDTPDTRALPAACANLRAWAAASHQAALALAADRALADRWLSVLDPGDLAQVRYSDSRQLGTLADTREVVRTLDSETTRGLLALGEGCGMDTVLHAAVAGTLADGTCVLLEAEGHGRPAGTRFNDARDTVEVGSTVGWFTATWPLRLSAAASGGTQASAPQAWLRAARAASAALPTDTASYGMLRHLAGSAGERLAAAEDAAGAQLLVNYLGRDAVADGEWQPAADAAALESELGLHRALPATHPVELNAYVTDAADGPHLVLRWQLAAANAAGRRLPDAARTALLGLSGMDPLAAGTTGALHDVVGLEAAEISRLLVERPAAQGIWPLTGVQQAMAVHAASAPNDTYLSLAGLELFGPVDPATLRKAAASLAALHPQLRSTVYWPEDGAPVFVPLAGLAPQVAVRRRPGLDLEARQQFAEEVRAEHMTRSLDVEAGPLLRLELVDFGAHPETGEPHSQLILANHHLLLDGWSIPPLVDELFEHYARAAGGAAVPPQVAPAGSGYDAFARSLAARDDQARVAEWRRVLSPGRPGHVLRHRDPENTALPTVIGIQLGAHVRKALAKRARKASATVADAANAAWALVLGALLDTDIPVYGTVSSGRAIDVPGMAQLPGMFIDTLPVAVDLEQKNSTALLGAAHAAGRRIVESAGVPLSKITGALGVGTLFDTLLIVENYPQTEGNTPDGAPRLGEIHSQDATEYPLSVSVSVGEVLEVELEFGAEVPETAARQVLSALVVAFECLALGTALPVLRGLLAARLAPAREALAAADARHTASHGADAAAVAAVAAAYGQVLRLPTAGADSDFFAAGGDSMAAMSLLSALRKAGYKATISQVFANPVAADLAAVVERLVPAAPAATSAGDSGEAPAAPALAAGKPMITLDGASMASLANLLKGN